MTVSTVDIEEFFAFNFDFQYDADVLQLTAVDIIDSLQAFGNENAINAALPDDPGLSGDQTLTIEAGDLFNAETGNVEVVEFTFTAKTSGVGGIAIVPDSERFIGTPANEQPPRLVDLPAPLEITANADPIANDDFAELGEDSSIEIDVLDNDEDPFDANPTIDSFTQGGFGEVTQTGGGLTYTPGAQFSGQDTFTYTVIDALGATATATVTVEVLSSNDAPTALADGATTAEDQDVTIDVLDNDSDIDGDTLTVTAASGAANGVVTVAANGADVTYSPNADFNGEDSFTYDIADGNGGTDTATVTVTVTPVNDDPTAGDDSASTNEDTAVLVDVLDNDGDVDGDTLTVTAAFGAANGTAAVVGGQVEYTPDANFNGTDSFTYEIADGNGGTASATVEVTVDPVNDAPVAMDDEAAVAGGESVTIDVLDNDEDPDGDTLSVESFGQGAKGTVALISTSDDQQLIYTPNEGEEGADSFTYQISDGNGGTDEATVDVTITLNNTPPVAVDDEATVAEDGQVAIDVLDNDTDADDDTLVIANVGNADHGTAVVIDGEITYTPDPGYNGDDSFSYVVSDQRGGTDIGEVSVTVTSENDAPEADDDFAFVNAGQAFEIDALANDSDADGDVLTIVSTSAAASGVVAITGGGVTYTPDAGFTGADSFTYEVSDGNGGTDTATVDVNVNGVVLEQTNLGSAGIGDEVQLELRTLPGFSEFSGFSADLFYDPTALSFVSVAYGSEMFGPARAEPVPATGVIENILGAFFDPLDPTAALSGEVSVATFTFETLTQSQSPVRVEGAATAEGFFQNMDGDVVFSGDAEATVVTNVNPVANDDVASTDEDTPVGIAIADLLANDTDADGDTLTFGPLGTAANGMVSQSGGIVTYTPDANFNGSDSFTYEVSDGNGGTDTATVEITVNPVNDAPVAVDDGATTDEDTAVEIAVLGNDTDVDGDTLGVTSFGQGTNGTVISVGNGVFNYTPNANFFGPDSFQYTVADGNGGTDTATVEITVNPVNDAPVAVDDSATTDEDTPVIIAALVNDTDVDGDTLSVGSFGQGANGAVSELDGAFTYTPDANFNGSDSFTYTVDDGNGGTDTATVSITVNPVNDGPVLSGVPSSLEVIEGEPAALFTASATDVEDDPITFSLGGADGDAFEIDEDSGVVTLGAGAAFESGAPAGQDQPFEFTVIASDGSTTTEQDVSLTLLRDSDGDFVADREDNATFVMNPDQRDTDGDNRGNVIDADFNQTGFVDLNDFFFFANFFGATGINDEEDEAANADFTGDGNVDLDDFLAFSGLFGYEVGTSFIDFTDEVA